MSWRNAQALEQLRTAVNRRWPNRDKRSDGTIGDAAHATRDSDHNPWMVVNGIGVVRAIDIDVDGINAGWLAEQLRRAGAGGDGRLTNGGYVIFNRRITKPDFSGWSVYNGTNPHTSHVHTSFSRNPADFDSNASWSFMDGRRPTAAAARRTGRPTLSEGNKGELVQAVQKALNARYPKLSRLAEDGIFGSKTADRVKHMQRQSGLVVDGIVGPKTWAKLGFK